MSIEPEVAAVPHSHKYAKDRVNGFFIEPSGFITVSQLHMLNIIKESYEIGAQKALDRIKEEISAA